MHDDLAAHFVPGVMLVPAGVAAINAVQEAHFTYLHSEA
jgi:intracellular sulfur oxidation DsrE/DsrF family protein